jgi:chorismate mutase
MEIRAIRGATKLVSDDAAEMEQAVSELLLEMVARNSIQLEDLVSVFFTATPDIKSAFPAAAARKLGWKDVPLMCSVEMDVVNSLKPVIRVMMHAKVSRRRNEIQHVYLRGAEVLRLDIAQ